MYLSSEHHNREFYVVKNIEQDSDHHRLSACVPLFLKRTNKQFMEVNQATKHQRCARLLFSLGAWDIDRQNKPICISRRRMSKRESALYVYT